MFNLALQIRTQNWNSFYLEQEGGLHSVSVRMLQTAALVLGNRKPMDGQPQAEVSAFDMNP